MTRTVSRVLAILLIFFLGVSSLPAPVLAEQRLQNGNFEQGITGWTGIGLSGSGCAARSGGGALALVTSATDQSATALQTIAGFINPGTYTLTGFGKGGGGGSASASAFLSWRNPSNSEVGVRTTLILLGPGYTSFTIADTPPASATRLIVRFVSSSGTDSTVCLDDLSLDGPSSLAPTPTPSPTAIPSATATPTASPTAVATSTPTAPTATSTSVVQPTATPTTPAGLTATSTTVAPTSTTAPATATATSGPGTPTATPQTVAPASTAMQFVNGGFEEGLRGWYRYGGELQQVSSPARSGGAGALTSSTSSTKWAFQVVSIDPARAYEFAGFLRSGGGVKSAYLRISWYDSIDGGGRALSTDDSPAKVTATGDAFVFLSTGGIAPPAAARSARLRVMLTPEGAGGTVVYLDDFSFVVTTPSRVSNPTADPDEPIETPVPTQTPRPSDTAVPTSTPGAAGETSAPNDGPTTNSSARASTSATASRATSRSGAVETASPIAQVLAARDDRTPAADSGQPEVLPFLDDKQSRGPATPLWALGVVVLFVSVGGGYWLAKHPVE